MSCVPTIPSGMVSGMSGLGTIAAIQGDQFLVTYFSKALYLSLAFIAAVPNLCMPSRSISLWAMMVLVSELIRISDTRYSGSCITTRSLHRLMICVVMSILCPLLSVKGRGMTIISNSLALDCDTLVFLFSCEKAVFLPYIMTLMSASFPTTDCIWRIFPNFCSRIQTCVGRCLRNASFSSGPMSFQVLNAALPFEVSFVLYVHSCIISSTLLWVSCAVCLDVHVSTSFS